MNIHLLLKCVDNDMAQSVFEQVLIAIEEIMTPSTRKFIEVNFTKAEQRKVVSKILIPFFF